MQLSHRVRDFVIAGGFLALVAGLAGLAWTGADAPTLPVLEPAPALALPRIDGGTTRLASLRGRPVVVNIWATWCTPCVREMPSLQRVYERYRDEGLEIVAVAVDIEPGERRADGRIAGVVSAFVEEHGLTFPVVVDPSGTTEQEFGTEYLPTTVLIDRQGRIRVREIGARDWDQEPAVDMIRALMEAD
ncbi:MAG: TlpA family protein disulfide reductase [Gemmatimonadota bacterium]